MMTACALSSAPSRASEPQGRALSDTLVLVGQGIYFSEGSSAFSDRGVGREVMDATPHIDFTKALYGRIAGLNVYQGSGTSDINISSLSVHGHAPLVLLDGFPCSVTNISPREIASVGILTDAAAAALYGVKGGNGIVMITTRHGSGERLRIGAGYQYGLHTQFRSPEFADAFTYASAVNTALAGDGLEARYSAPELEAFRSGNYPDEYPNVDWWNETMNRTSSNHRLNLTFEGEDRRFRYWSLVDFMYDRSLFKENRNERRYDTYPADMRLQVRTNVDVDITRSTVMELGVSGKISEVNRAQYGNIMGILYNTPSAVFPIRHRDGIYGGNNVYGKNNPVALVMDSGNYKLTTGTMNAHLSLIQKLDMLAEGLSADVSVSLDNLGTMFDSSSRSWRYEDAGAKISEDGTLVTHPVIYGTDSEILSHSQSFYSMYLNIDFKAKLQWDRTFGRHKIFAAAVYDQVSAFVNGRNNSWRNQSVLAVAGYTWASRYSLNLVGNCSGSSCLPPGSRFSFYPAANAAWILSNEPFMRGAHWLDLLKLFASCGISGWDGSLSHELYLQSYGSADASSYFFTNGVTSFPGMAEGSLPVENVVPEKSERLSFGTDFRAFGDRLSLYAEGFFERRSNILVQASSSVSEVVGIGVGLQPIGRQTYRGFDASLAWNDSQGKFSYGLYANSSYVLGRVVEEGQAYQEYGYLYHNGNRVGQCYGLEATGIFQSQMEINNSPRQTFSEPRPGDLRYRDQNGDNIIDDRDMVKMRGSTLPRFYFGFGFSLGYAGFNLSAEFQGLTGKTVNLLDATLYWPLLNGASISQTLLDREVPWTPDNAERATMPRLTTLSNDNNYRNSSFWYRDGSFLKLRDLTLSYTFGKDRLKFADLTLYVKGTNLFSIDGLGIVDPEHLGAAYPALRTVWTGVKFNF